MQWEEIAIPSTRSQTMSVFSRLTDVINANLHSLLDKSEEPEKMLRLMIEEMEQVQVEMRTQAARVIAEQKQLERHQQGLQAQI
ncbi:PspA/IM30 family protein, partial [Aeromonas sp. HMWF036]|uniref:PspA/IM30 family protein n=1 Tax=Aeromonas sp. HMWF036 TaxID=2056869 RepID=UPI002159D7F2